MPDFSQLIIFEVEPKLEKNEIILVGGDVS